MSVNIRNPLTGELTNAAGGVINPKSINEMIAPIEDGTASKAYAVGEQFIMNDLLCEATQPIAQGDTMVIGTNCAESEQLSKQVKDINTSLTANGNRFEAGYSSENDEYGFNINSTFYPIGASSGGGGSNVVPLLDFDNAIDLTSTEITTTRDGAIIGNLVANGNNQLYINNVLYCQNGSSAVDEISINYIPKGTKIKLGLNTTSTYKIRFVPYNYQSVDPEVTVFNEAEVELNYTTPLHTFTTGNLSYTATKDCWVVGNLWGNGDGILYINNTGLGFATYDGNVATTTNVFLKVSRGDTVRVNRACPQLCVLEGTISGSVGGLGGYPDLDWSTPLHTFGTVGSYTATEDCYLTGFVSNTGVLLTLTINGTQVISGNYGSGGVIAPIKIHSGDVVSTNILSSALHVLQER